MKEKAPSAKKIMDTDEDLLNFDLDDIPSEDLDQSMLDEDEEIVELVELVEKGDEERIKGAQLKTARGEETVADLESDLDLRTDEMARIQKLVSKEEDAEEGILDVSDITLELSREEEQGRRRSADITEEENIGEVELEGLLVEEAGERVMPRPSPKKRAGVEEKGGELEITEADLEDLLEEGFGEEKEAESSGELESRPLMLGAEPPQAGSEELAEEELSEIEGALDLEGLPEKQEVISGHVAREELSERPLAPPEPAFQEMAGMTEEQLETVITRVVHDVVEKVARETMANVAEKLITQAIEALKKSMEPRPA